jgi:omega-amidase
MKIAAFQFKGRSNIVENTHAIQRGILKASEQNVRLLITQECALCGYPPLETEKASQVDIHQVEGKIEQISQLAIQHRMYIVLGTIITNASSYTNSMVLISPDGERQPVYHKRALWGWDRDNFTPGHETGVITIDDLRLGFRICYEVRFPEYFRELFRERVEIACVSFCDVEKEPNPARYELIKSHLITRAVENAMYVLSVNSISAYQTAPTCLIDPDGEVLEIAPRNGEYLLTLEYARSGSNFGRDGRIHYSKELLGI